ncbi:hypothetical protein M8C21_033780 [Ambrosia artemisiifolia]|uniref:Uncharacterized protein n=1 Tax=Ambrosia artemisiifolia TaxID=4212 RepID=A0AAD5BT18_AMBAR|nr:hypothetical protein M8C21_033780 [Ambrosia artemisiifolia]
MVVELETDKDGLSSPAGDAYTVVTTYEPKVKLSSTDKPTITRTSPDRWRYHLSIKKTILANSPSATWSNECKKHTPTTWIRR